MSLELMNSEEELEVIAEKTPSNRKQDSEGAHELAARLFRAIAATVYFFVPVHGSLYEMSNDKTHTMFVCECISVLVC